MPAQPLTPAQLSDAARLAALFEQWKAARRAQRQSASQEVAAALLGFSSQSSISQYVNGKIPLNIPALIKFCGLFSCDPADVSPDLAVEMSKIAAAGPAADSESEHVAVPMVDAKASAGKGELVLSGDTAKMLMFRRDYLKKNGAGPADVLAFEVRGNSMIDLHIPDGSIVLANRKRREPINKRVFLLWIDGKLLVKEMIRVEGRWMARSHNAAETSRYTDIPIGDGDRIEGRAFWCGFGL